MAYYPRPPAELCNLPKPTRRRVAEAAWRSVCWSWGTWLFCYLLLTGALAAILDQPRWRQTLITSWTSLPAFMVDWGGCWFALLNLTAFAAFILVAQHIYRRAIHAQLLREGLRPHGCLLCQHPLWDCAGHACPRCEAPLAPFGREHRPLLP